MSGERLVVVGDLLLDRDVDGRVERLSPDAPVPVLDEGEVTARPGGAGLAALLAAGDGWEVTLVTALAADAAGQELRDLLAARAIDVIDLGLDGHTPEKIRLRAGDRSLVRLDRGGRPGAVGAAGRDARAAVESAAGVLVSDYGRGLAADPGLRQAVAVAGAGLPVVWDPHPRGPAPPPGVTVATPNEAEVRAAHAATASMNGNGRHAMGGLRGSIDAAAALRARWQADALCMTRGADGAVLVRDGRPPIAAPARPVAFGDPCGAGDRFASRLAVRLAAGMRLEDAVGDAVACATAFVAAGGARAAMREPGHPRAGHSTAAPGVVDQVRMRGGTVVATGGCFDLLHAGHVRTLESARQLGDVLVVLLNSDASVRRLKGSHRPLVPEQDRAALLAALACVDAVEIFDEDSPVAALETLRPDVWVKGGDYDGAALPEAESLRRWGGRVVLVPYVEGRSTTRLIEEAACRA